MAEAPGRLGLRRLDPATERFELPAAVAAVLADDTHAGMIEGFATMLETMAGDAAVVEEAYRSGGGVGWHERSAAHWHGMDLATRAAVIPALVPQWVPALDGVEERLRAGATVADVGCGFGAALITLAQAYPDSRFWGFDYHDGSIASARKAAAAAGVADRVTFEVASAAAIPLAGFDLILYIDTFHDLGDPVGALRRSRQALRPDGTVLLVEFAGSDRLEENFTPFGRLMYASRRWCARPTPCRRAPPTRWAASPARAGWPRSPRRSTSAACGGCRWRPRSTWCWSCARSGPRVSNNLTVAPEPWSPPVFGREPAMSALRAGLEAAASGRGRLVLVTGDAGIGKTAVVAALAGEATGAGSLVLWGQCWEGGGAPAYWPWVQVLRAGMAAGGDADEAARLLPETDSASPPVTGASPDARFRLFDAMARHLAGLAARRPTVVVLDDLQWADESSLAMLEDLPRLSDLEMLAFAAEAVAAAGSAG